jgi:hypothetical protein
MNYERKGDQAESDDFNDDLSQWTVDTRYLRNLLRGKKMASYTIHQSIGENRSSNDF